MRPGRDSIVELLREADHYGIYDGTYKNEDGSINRWRLTDVVREARAAEAAAKADRRSERTTSWRWWVGIGIMLVIAAATVWTALEN